LPDSKKKCRTAKKNGRTAKNLAGQQKTWPDSKKQLCGQQKMAKMVQFALVLPRKQAFLDSKKSGRTAKKLAGQQKKA
jgi:hypothetical protein